MLVRSVKMEEIVEFCMSGFSKYDCCKNIVYQINFWSAYIHMAAVHSCILGNLEAQQHTYVYFFDLLLLFMDIFISRLILLIFKWSRILYLIIFSLLLKIKQMFQMGNFLSNYCLSLFKVVFWNTVITCKCAVM